MKFNYDYNSPGKCLTYPNPASGLFIDENYCRAHIRPGQDIVDAWGANLRREYSLFDAMEQLDKTAYLDDEMLKYKCGRKKQPHQREYTQERHRKIVELARSGMMIKDIAARVGMTRWYVGQIVRRWGGE